MMKPSILFLIIVASSISSSTADLIRVEYEAEVRTVTNAPFGNVAPMGTLVAGYFVYDTSIPDTYVISTPNLGAYVHAGTGEFEAVFPTMTITGSKAHTVVINDTIFSDTFRIVDGERDSGFEGGIMKVNGAANENVELDLSITAGGSTFSSDAQPNPFSLTSPESPYPNPNTFTLSDENGILSLQLIRVYFPRMYVPVDSVSYSTPDDLVTLLWQQETGKNYSVEFSATLSEWTTIASGISGGTFMDMLPARDSPEVPPLSGFYRVFE